MEPDAVGTYFEIVDIVHFVENNPFDIPDQVCALVQHASQDLRLCRYESAIASYFEHKVPYRHDETTCFRVDLNISSQDTDVLGTEGLLEVAILLVRQGLDRRSIDCSAQMFS